MLLQIIESAFIKLTLFWLFFVFTPTSGYPSAAATDNRVNPNINHEEQIRLTDVSNQVNDGSNVTWLTTETTNETNERFLALYRADQSGLRYGSVLILHDRGQHLNWPGLLQALRTELPQEGWATLSVALPDFQENPDNTEEPDNRKTYFAISEARLKSAIDFWQSVEQGPALVITFGLSAHTWFAAVQNGLTPPSVLGHLLVDGYQLLPATEFNLTEVVLGQTTPTMEWIKNTANNISQGEQRHIKAQQNNHSLYQSYPLPSLDMLTQTDTDLILKKVRQWLNQQVKPVSKTLQ